MSYSTRRRSSAYDFASLRLHPDGTRVSQSSTTNRNPRNSRLALQDSRGNWFARDAAGLVTVPKYRRVCELIQEEEQGSRSGRKRKASGKRPDPRTVKRRKFYDDFEFLTATVDESLPSSDLLKCLHYFGAEYYHERGQLINASREYRLMRKHNAQLRRETQAAQEAAGVTGPIELPRRGGRVKGQGKVRHPTDMYRVLDGSALIALGMLVEAWVAKFMEVSIPEGWEETLQSEYMDTEEEVDEEDGEDGEKDGEDEEEDGEEEEEGEGEQGDRESETSLDDVGEDDEISDSD